MVPPASHKVSRVSWYSGSCQPLINFAYGIFTLSDQISQNCSAIDSSTLCSPQPRGARTTVWALSISLAATLEIDVSFFSSGYLDVSVHRVRLLTLCIQIRILIAEWVSPFGYLRINGYLLLPEAFRSLSRPSSALSAKASTLRS